MKNFFKKERKFLIRSYRKLEILLLILDGVYNVYDMCRMLPSLSHFTVYKLLKRYRMQGLVKVEHETMCGKMVLRFEVTERGFYWLMYMLDKEAELRKERGLDFREIDDLIYRLSKRRAKEKEAKREARKRMFPYLYEEEEIE